jgi:hypothetical protein
MSATQFPSGLRVSTFEPPPPGFDPLQAQDAELIKHGFPRRPMENPRALQRYEAVLRRLQGKLDYVVPTFQRREHIIHRPLERVAGTETFFNWSGAIQHAPAGQAFTFVMGDWTVPNVYPLGQDQWYTCASWIGIDGDSTPEVKSPDVCQVGIECQVIEFGVFGFTARNVYAWWEWFPENEIAISNFPVAPGDEISAAICTSGAGATTATAFIANQSSGEATSFKFYAPTGTQLVGNSAEWVVERPDINGVRTQLADYGSVFFFEAAAYDGSDLLQAGNGNNANMVSDSQSSIISLGNLETPTVIQCLYTGSRP